MATYPIAVYKNNRQADLDEVKGVLNAAGIEVFEVDEIQVFVNALEVTKAVEVLNAAGFETDEDEATKSFDRRWMAANEDEETD